MLDAAAVAKARAVVITTRNFGETKRVVGNLHHFYPGVPVMTAVPYLFQRDELRALGARDTVALMPEGMLDFGVRVLCNLQIAPEAIAHLTAELRADDYALLRGVGGAVPAAEIIGPPVQTAVPIAPD
jgi:voltage-gated potassium channel Kch